MELEKLHLKEGGEISFENKQIFIVHDDESICGEKYLKNVKLKE